MKAEWHKAPAFAEVAEALGINTSQIMAAANPASNLVVVVYTEEMADDISYEEARQANVYTVALRRGSDGILFVASQPLVAPVAEMLDDLERHMRDKFGEPS